MSVVSVVVSSEDTPFEQSRDALGLSLQHPPGRPQDIADFSGTLLAMSSERYRISLLSSSTAVSAFAFEPISTISPFRSSTTKVFAAANMGL